MKSLLAALLVAVPLWAKAQASDEAEAAPAPASAPVAAPPPLVSSITAYSFIVTDMSGVVIAEKNADDIRSIASLTKLIITKVAADQDQEEKLTVLKEDMKVGRMRTTPLRVGKSYTRHELIELALISSDNVAALTLGRHLPPGTELPVTEASGLNPENQQTARQMAELARSLYHTEVATISVQPTVKVGNKERHSTNPLLEKKGWSFYLSKTGFIDASGGCIAVITEIAGELRTIVILGSKDTRQRWKDLAVLRKELGDSEFYEPEWKRKVAKKSRQRSKPVEKS